MISSRRILRPIPSCAGWDAGQTYSAPSCSGRSGALIGTARVCWIHAKVWQNMLSNIRSDWLRMFFSW